MNKNKKQLKKFKEVETMYGDIIPICGDGYCLYRCVYYYLIDNNKIDKKIYSSWLHIFYELFTIYCYQLLYQPYNVIELFYEKLTQNINGDERDINLLSKKFKFFFIIIQVFMDGKHNFFFQNFNDKKIENYAVFMHVISKNFINSHCLYINRIKYKDINNYIKQFAFNK